MTVAIAIAALVISSISLFISIKNGAFSRRVKSIELRTEARSRLIDMKFTVNHVQSELDGYAQKLRDLGMIPNKIEECSKGLAEIYSTIESLQNDCEEVSLEKSPELYEAVLHRSKEVEGEINIIKRELEKLPSLMEKAESLAALKKANGLTE